MAYLEWGDPRNRDVLVCVHGLTRTGRDFDELARALCGRFRVVCPDVAGRGDSDRLADPMLYGVPQYVADMVTLIARLDVEAVSWLGTSMGGLIGMALAAQAGSPVKRLVLNDVGPVITQASLERIASYVGKAPALAEHRAGGSVHSPDLRALRPAQRRAMALAHRDLDAERRRLAGALRPAHRRAVPRHGAGEGPRALAAVRRGALPDAGAARRAIRSAFARDDARMAPRGPKARWWRSAAWGMRRP